MKHALQTILIATTCAAMLGCETRVYRHEAPTQTPTLFSSYPDVRQPAVAVARPDVARSTAPPPVQCFIPANTAPPPPQAFDRTDTSMIEVMQLLGLDSPTPATP